MRRWSSCCGGFLLGCSLWASAAGAAPAFVAVGAAAGWGAAAGRGLRLTLGLLHRNGPSHRWALRGFLERSRATQVQGQDREQAEEREAGFGWSWEHRWPLGYRWHPWLGGEIGYVSNLGINRYRISRQGYLVTPLPDASGSGLLLGLLLDNEWRLAPGLVSGISVEYQREMAAYGHQLIISLTGRYWP